MKNFAFFGKKQRHLYIFSLINFIFHGGLARVIAFHVNPYFIRLSYFMILSLFGYLGLKVSRTRTPIRPKDLDLFYTSVSASTISSLTAVEMEAFSNSQLILLTFLMFLGGEVFTSLLELVFARYFNSTQNHGVKNRNYKKKAKKYRRKKTKRLSNTSLSLKQGPATNDNRIELSLVSSLHSENHNENDIHNNVPNSGKSLKYLSHVVLGYLLVVHFVGFILVYLYVTFVPSARQVLQNKGIKIPTFSIFTIVSSFASCGFFVPTNENMMVFKKDSGLPLLILPHLHLDNTLYPPCLRLVIWVLEKVTKIEEFSYLLENSKEMGYCHLFPGLHCWLLVAAVLGFNVVQFVKLCFMEWNSHNMEGMNLSEKLVASLFQVTNARHAGESSVFDLSAISSAILVLFVVMMYLPPYTTFSPIREHENDVMKRDKRTLVECIELSQLSYLVIFIILMCITESSSLREDSLNFNVLNITIEVLSAYGDVGFSTGYSCARQLKPNGDCEDLWVGSSGRWSSKGKFILILVMFFGRLKKFNVKGGNAWNLS